MYSAYILYSVKDGKLYVGCTADLTKRLDAHMSGKVIATRHRRPFALIHKEEYEKKADAFNRERFLKSLWSGRFKKKIVRDYLWAKSARGGSPK